MVIITDANGNIQTPTIPENVYQGSNLANEIVFLAPLPQSNQVSIVFNLPNGMVTEQKYMTPYTSVPSEYNLSAWVFKLAQDITLYYGQVTFQIRVYNADSIVTTCSGSFTVSKGVVPLPSSTPSSSTFEEILTYLSTLSGDVANLENTIDGIELDLSGYDERITTAQNTADSKIGVVTIENSTGTLTSAEFNNLITNNYLLKYGTSLYIKNGDTETHSVFSKVVSITNSSEILLLDTDYFMVNNGTRVYNRVTTQHQTYSKTKIDDLIQNVTIPIDDELSNSSENPVQNKVITNVINSINLKIPSGASSSNKMTTRDEVVGSVDLTIDSSTYVVTLQCKDVDGNNLGSAKTIDLPLESVVVGGSYDSTNKKVILTLENGQTIEFSVADLVSGLQTELSASNKLDADYIQDGITNKVFTATDKSKVDNSVQKTGNEDIYGLKTFEQRPKVGIEQELPSAYSQLDYIQSTNGQYISTGYNANAIGKSIINLSFDDITTEQCVLGFRATVGGASSRDGGEMHIRLQGGLIKYTIWGRTSTTSPFYNEYTYSSGVEAEIDKVYEVETAIYSNSQSIKVDGETKQTSNINIDNASATAYLFKGYSNVLPSYIKLYSCKLYNTSGTLIRDYVPCKRITDDAIGLYDFVSETFYPSASTSFVAGPETIPSDNDRVMLKGDIDKITTLDGTETEINGLVLKGERVKFPQGQIIQVDTMPSASASNNGQIVQYIGTTTLTYTNGYFYKSNGTSWDNINVQPSSGGSGISNYEVIDRVNSIPTATATSPDFIQVAGINYAKKRTIDLSNTTWLLNNTPTLLTGDPIFNINFTSNSSNFNVFYFITTTGNTDLFYAETGLTNIVHAYSEQSTSWVDGDNYKTIEITGGNDANNESLYNWLVENATLQSGTVVGYEYESIGGLATYHYFEEV